MAYLRVYNLNSNIEQCGGTFIADNWVITAHHCIIDAFHIELFAGKTFLTSENAVEPSQFDIIDIVTHPNAINHPRFVHLNDVALLKVKHRVGSFSARPICMPKKDEIPQEGDSCYVAGWGLKSSIRDGAEVAVQLQIAEIPISNIYSCAAVYMAYSRRVLLDGRNICAGEMLGGADTCLGDSGGPLMCQRKDSCAWYIAGIISWSYSCGETYGVYMSTNYYRDWALNAMQHENDVDQPNS